MSGYTTYINSTSIVDKEFLKTFYILENGAIDFDEFLSMMQNSSKEDTEEEFKEAFRMFDKNNDDMIDEKELKEVMTALGEKLTDTQIKEMIIEADLNGDGLINYHGRFCWATARMGWVWRVTLCSWMGTG